MYFKDEIENSLYDVIIDNKGQLLGLGSDVHTAFNVLGTPFNTLTHIVKLT
jgi:6-phosphogluconolactonase/glucosamine-6-phosphate isomerase/deaminase